MSRENLNIAVRWTRGRFVFQADFSLEPGRGVRVVGPSGSGKSTLLRLIAGHDAVDGGFIAFGDEVWSDPASGRAKPPHRRGAALLFQDARLFDHLDVAGNLALAERAARHRGLKLGPAFKDVIAAFDIEHLLRERSSILSGGERQRVALAQAVLSRPALLLLDEPFAAQDEARREACSRFLLEQMRKRAFGVILASHGEDPLSSAAAQSVLFSEGKGRLAAPAP